MRKCNWNLLVDVLILAVLLFSVWPLHPVHAQLAAQGGFPYVHITTATNTQVKSAVGQLHNITINGGTLTGVITVVDTSAANCSGGTNIAVIAANQVAAQNYSYDLQFNNGLCITSAAAVDATVTFR